MTDIDRFLLTIIGALIIWAVQQIISHNIRKSRFRGGLLADINLHIDGAKEQREGVKTLVEDTAQEGQKLPFPISYVRDPYNFYTSNQKELPIYFSEAELIKVIKFYQAIKELDISINGIADTLGIWERDKRELTDKDIKHLKKRMARIESFCNVICVKEIMKISELPDDYRKVKGIETVVEKT
jgi:hypothetical protein